MEARGQVVKTRWNRYGVPQRMNLVVGRVQGHPKGFAFVIPDAEGQDDVYIAPGDLNGAMHNDRVIARLHSRSKGAKVEGEVIRILERFNTTVVGTLEKGKKYGLVVPDDNRLSYDIFVSKEDYGGAVNQEKVVAEITRWPEDGAIPKAGSFSAWVIKDAPGTDILSIICKHQLPLEFPREVLREAERVPEFVTPSGNGRAHRLSPPGHYHHRRRRCP